MLIDNSSSEPCPLPSGYFTYILHLVGALVFYLVHSIVSSIPMPGKQKDETRGLVKDVAPLKLESAHKQWLKGVVHRGSVLTNLMSLEHWTERKGIGLPKGSRKF